MDSIKISLFSSVIDEDIDYLKILLEYPYISRYFNDKDMNGNTILHLSIYGKNKKIIKLLLDQSNIKICFNNQNNFGHTPLDLIRFLNNNKIN